ncbi:MAG TPA: hypothetical protein VFE30_09985 [Anaeromyxobacteraceae bacterium]|jgi:anti-sigma factor RsiW|nr:hypothetical protein [Anaeromyxobacteraceae bacterium]
MMAASCEALRLSILDLHAGRLDAAAESSLRAHLATCEECARAEKAERVLTEVLQRGLPRHAAPRALLQRLAERHAPAASRPARRPRLPLRTLAAAAALLAVAGAALLAGERLGRREGLVAGLAAEAVNDHLRVLQGVHPIEVESGGSHQVKPWFEGRLDFAPSVPDPATLGVPDLALRGGAVGWFVDRRAAVLAYRLRLHQVSLLVFRADGLAWPDAPRATASARGFHAVLWRRGGLGHALVSDVDPAELARLAGRFGAPE